MINILRDTQNQFQEVHTLLHTNALQDTAYFTKLSMATEEAYVLMNEGMCANSSVCTECAEHRDFIRSLLDVLTLLEAGNPLSEVHTKLLAQYSERVDKILKKIRATLAS